MTRSGTLLRVLGAASFLLLSCEPAGAAFNGRRALARFPILDSIDVIVRDDEVIAIAGSLGGPIRERLGVDEEVLSVETQGEVAIVATTERVLAATSDSPRWMWAALGVHESLPLAVALGDRVALVLTDDRAIGLAAGCRKKLFAEDIGPNEEVENFYVGDSVAVVITDKRLLGMSAFLPGFFEQQVGIHEKIEYVSALADFATVSTRERLLVFQAPTATWQQRRLSLH